MRFFLMVYNVLVPLTLLIARSDAGCSMTSPCLDDLGQGKPFAEPEQFSSTSTSWNIQLDVVIGEIQFGWLKLRRRLYNGKAVGPTWNVKKGDHLDVILRNRLGRHGNFYKRPNVMQEPNTTNIHTHGLHISSREPQDNLILFIKPGETYEYKYRIHEAHSSGTFWYHAHVHTSTLFQVHGGLAGMLIINDEVSTMPRQLRDGSCPDNCDADIQMVFQPLLQYSNGISGFGKIQAQIGDYLLHEEEKIITDQNKTLSQWLADNVNLMTTNGLLQPVLTLKQHKMYRFRMTNAGVSDTLELFITKKGTNTPTRGCKIREIACDGVYLDQPRKLHQGQSFIAPANRIDWMVKCDEPGEYDLRSYPDERNKMSVGHIDRYDGLLVSISVEPRRKTDFPPLEQLQQPESEFPSRLPARAPFEGDLRNLKESDIKQRFIVELDTRRKLNREEFSGGEYFRYAMTVNTVQEWQVVSTDTVDSHPLHVHINHFQVISYNKYTGPFSPEKGLLLYSQEDKVPCYYQRAGIGNTPVEPIPDDALLYLGHDERYKKDLGDTLAYAREGEWRDTLLIPPLSNITIRFMPERYTGTCIMHCHILNHEDFGMMAAVKIVNEGESLEAHIKSGNAYPGSCRKCDRYPFNNPRTLCDPHQDETDNNFDHRPAFATPGDEDTRES